MKKYSTAFRISAIFMVISILYIIFSDAVTSWILPADIRQLTLVQTIKGLVYVVITSIIIFFLIQREIARRKDYIDILEKQKARLYHFTNDIKEARENLERRNEFIETILDNLPIGLAVNNISDGTVTYMNSQFAKIYGWDKDEIYDIDKFFERVYPNEKYRERIRARIMKDIESGDRERMKWSGIRATGKDGTVRIIEAENIPHYQQNLMISTVQDITDRIKIEESNKEYQVALRRLTSELLLTEEKHRKDIAANIHDNLNQILVGSGMKLTRLLKEITNNQYRDILQSIKKSIEEAIKSSREITYDLSPPILYQFGLTEATKWLAEKTENENDIKVICTIEYDPTNLPETHSILTYRAIQELITNVIKHAKARKVEIRFRREDENLVITIKDDGIGFHGNTENYSITLEGGFGLFAVSERLNSFNGMLRVQSEVGKGTEAHIIIPEIYSSGG